MISRKPSKVVTGKDGFILDDLMSLTIKPMSELKMKYINMLRERTWAYGENCVCCKQS